MIEKYRDKYVKVLVSSESGAGVSGEISRYISSLITVFGTIKDFDDRFIELSNTTMVYYNGMGATVESYGILNPDNVKQPSAFENKSSILSLDKIISISLVE